MRTFLKWATLPLWIIPATGLFLFGYCLGKLMNRMNGEA